MYYLIVSVFILKYINNNVKFLNIEIIILPIAKY